MSSETASGPPASASSPPNAGVHHALRRRSALLVAGVCVAILLFGTWLLISYPPGTQHPSTTPIGLALGLKDPIAGVCSASEASDGSCTSPGNLIYTVSVDVSTVPLNGVLFGISNSSGGQFVNPGPAEISLVQPSGSPVAFSTIPAGEGLAMTSSWSHYATGYSPSSPLSTRLTILVDFGEAASVGQTGLELLIHGANGYTGTETLSLS
jgi:hypothetical protein